MPGIIVPASDACEHRRRRQRRRCDKRRAPNDPRRRRGAEHELVIRLWEARPSIKPHLNTRRFGSPPLCSWMLVWLARGRFSFPLWFLGAPCYFGVCVCLRERRLRATPLSLLPRAPPSPPCAPTLFFVRVCVFAGSPVVGVY